MQIKHLLKTVALIMSVAMFGSHVDAQQILFRNYSVEDGLCSNTIWSIEQDEKGLLWFGTKNGLNSFNGYEFKTYRFQKQNNFSIGNNFIHAICKYDEKTLWLGTEDGIYILNLETEKFKHFKPAAQLLIFDIIRDRKGNVWFASGGSGIFKYNSRDKSVQNFKMNLKDSNSLSLNSVRTLAEDDQGKIWIGTFGEGVDVLDPATLKFTHFKSGDRDSELNANRIMKIYKDMKGNMWIGSLDGLKVWLKESNQFKSYKKGGAGSINENFVRALYQPSPDKLYVGTEKGLNVLDINSQKFTAFVHKNNDPRSISDNAVYSIYPDKDGGIWIGTYFGGLNYFPKKGSGLELYYATGEKNSLPGNAVSSFVEDRPGYFYVGTENAGLSYFDSYNKTFTSYPFRPSQKPLSYHNIHSLLKDKSGNLWIGTFSGGLNVLNPETGAVKTYTHNKGDTTSLSNNNVYSLYQDKEGVIWVGTTRGVNIYRPETDAFSHVKQMMLDKSVIYGIYEDASNNIWFATYNNGLIAKNKANNKWLRYTADGGANSLSSNRIISMLDDDLGNLWLGTDGGGLNRFNKASRTFTVYDERHGISPIIYGILKDDNGQLWLSTNGGIIRFSPEDGKSTVYSNFDDLQSNNFNYNAFLKASDGKMYFGGINGFNAFYPDSLNLHSSPATVALTNFQLFNKNVPIGDTKSPLQKGIAFNDALELDYDQSVISFEYAALSYFAPAKINYAYMMEGFDRNWNFVGRQRKATYTNLPPGSYTFKVKATDVYGNWRDDGTSMKLIVHPPFYRSTFAYFVYAFLLVGMVLGMRRFYYIQARKRNEVKLARMKSQREQEFYNQKMEFFTTMAHEIRTPLSLIIAPLERLMASDDWKPEVKDQLNVMDENSDRLLNLVNQLLDFRRIESDIYTIRREKVEIISFLQSLYSRFSSMSYQKEIRFSMFTSTNQLEVEADPEALTKILTNLLINAFKFSKEKVEMRFNELQSDTAGKQFISISIVDDGKGIPLNELDNIFKPFFKIDTQGQADNISGTGIGLALAKSLAEKHGGQLSVESRQDLTTTTFTLLIPYVKPAAADVPTSIAAENGFDPGEPEKGSILIVEDDSSLLEFITKSFIAEHYRVLVATNGVEAITVLETNEIDLIISDVMMPEMDGVSLCRYIKTNIEHSHIPFVLLTAKGNSESEIAGLENGADAYMAKPFKWKHLTVVVKNLLESKARLKAKFMQQPLSDVAVLSTNTHDKHFIEQLISIIEDRLQDSHLSVEELSKEMAMCRSSLHKKLKAMSGYVPNEFIRLIRLKNAARMLLSGKHNISEVGYLVGFNSHSYFSKCFMQQFHETPSEFAERHLDSKMEKIEKIGL